MFDVGDPIPLSVSVYDATGVLANATAVALTVTLPDGTTSAPAVTNASAGVYTATGPSTQAGRHGVRWIATGTNASAYTDAYDVAETVLSGIVSLADVRAHLNMTSTANDEELRRFIAAATDFIESEIGYVVRRTVTETLYPNSGVLFLEGPVLSLTSMVSAYGYTAVYDTTTMYVDGSSGLIRAAYGTRFLYPVTVTFVAGRVVVPALVQQAALDYVKWMWESQRGATALPLPGGDFEVQTPATVPYRITQALRSYRVPVVA